MKAQQRINLKVVDPREANKSSYPQKDFVVGGKYEV